MLRIDRRHHGMVAIVALLLTATIPASATAPQMREGTCLNGSWTQGGSVPFMLYGSGNTYVRTINILPAWAGKKIFLQLDAVNYGDVTSIDGVQVGSSTGPWMPHAYDITQRATPGSHTVTIVANGTKPAGWPNGFPKSSFGGLIFDVNLQVFGMIGIRDAEVITSVTNKTITVNYEMQNFGTTSRTFSVNANIYPSAGGGWVLSFATNTVTLA